MDTPKKKKKSRDLLPKKAQIVLLVVGIPLLIFSVVRFSTTMGWIGGPPKAKRVVQKKTDKPKDTPKPGAAEPAQPGPTAAAPVSGPKAGPPDLDSIELAARDPLADLPASGPGPAPGQPSPPRPGGAPAPPAQPSGPPILPPPMPTPGSTPAFPSPVTGEAPALPPEMVVSRPVERGLPPALSASYPILRRGGRAARSASVSLVGTISGPQGSLAVVRSAGSAGAPGRYVRPGQRVSGQTDDEVKEIGPGKLTLKSRGRPHELSLPAPRSETSEAAGSTPDEARRPATEGPQASVTSPIAPVAAEVTATSPPTE
jgi:hypothetical protein